METEDKLRLADVFVSISDPRQAGKVEHDLVELLVVAVNVVLVGAGQDTPRDVRHRGEGSWTNRDAALLCLRSTGLSA